jgi:glycopeptide antibiotics resistance protein
MTVVTLEGAYLGSRSGSVKALALTSLSILVLTLFPFTFSDSQSEFLLGFDVLANSKFPDLFDVLANLFLFVPMGFTFFWFLICRCNSLSGRLIAGTDHRKLWRYCLLTVLFCSTLSLSIELMQQFLPSRYPSISDWILNTVGGGLGVLLYQRFSAGLVARYNDCGAWIQKNLRRQHLIVMILGYIVGANQITDFLQPTNDLSNWASGYHLMLGNEFSGNRQWLGEIDDLNIFDKAFTKLEVALLVQSSLTDYPSVFSFSDGDQGGFRTHVDAAALRLSRTGERCGELSKTEHSGARILPQCWYKTTKPAQNLIERLKASNQFTLSVKVKPYSIQLFGPARIVSLSKNSQERNFTLGQESSDLVFRVRTPFTGLNGTKPELVIPKVFSENEERSIVVVLNDSSLVVYVDGVQNSSSLDFNPGISLVSRFSQVDSSTTKGWRVVYYSASAVPLGVLLALLFMRIERKFVRRLYCLGAVLVYPFIVNGESVADLSFHSSFAATYAVSFFAVAITFTFTLWVITPQGSNVGVN